MVVPCGLYICCLVGGAAAPFPEVMTHKTAWCSGLIDCPLCYEGARGRAFHKGHAGHGGESGREQWLMALARRNPVVGPGPGGTVPGGDWSKWYPSLVEFLGMSAWPDGKCRATGTVMLLTEDGVWKIWLHDRDTQEGLWLSGVTPEAVLESAERSLSEGTGEWRKDRPAGRKGAR